MPKSLRASNSQLPTEIRRSLHTRSRQKAQYKASQILVQVMAALFIAEKNVRSVEALFLYFANHILSESCLPDYHREKLVSFYLDLNDKHKDLFAEADFTAVYKRSSQTILDIRAVLDVMASELLEADYRRSDKLFRELTDLTYQFIGEIQNIDDLPSLTDLDNGSVSLEPLVPITSKHTLQPLMDSFITEKVRSDVWKARSKDDNIGALSLFVEFASPERDASTIDKELIRDYKNLLQRLPKNRKKFSQYKDVALNDFATIAVPKDKLISVETINKNLSRLSAFLNWCVDQGYLDDNPASSMQIKQKQRASDKRLPFTAAELNTLFADPIFTGKKRPAPYQFWLPLLGLYTGARIGELAQIYLDDIKHENGIDFITITDERDDQNLKTVESKRRIPIHHTLIDIGLLDYLAYLKKKNIKRLFDELTLNRDGYSQGASKWFGRFKKQHGLPNDTKTFHSFRHTFIQQLKNSDTQEHVTAALAGHRHKSITYQLYGTQTGMALLNEHVQKIEYLEFDLSLIKWLVR